MKNEEVKLFIKALKKIGNWGGMSDEELPGSFAEESKEPDWWKNLRLQQEYEELMEKQGKQDMLEYDSGSLRIPMMKQDGLDYKIRSFDPWESPINTLIEKLRAKEKGKRRGSI